MYSCSVLATRVSRKRKRERERKLIQKKKNFKRQTLGKEHPYLFSQSEPVSEKQNDILIYYLPSF